MSIFMSIYSMPSFIFTSERKKNKTLSVIRSFHQNRFFRFLFDWSDCLNCHRICRWMQDRCLCLPESSCCWIPFLFGSLIDFLVVERAVCRMSDFSSEDERYWRFLKHCIWKQILRSPQKYNLTQAMSSQIASRFGPEVQSSKRKKKVSSRSGSEPRIGSGSVKR